LLTIVSCNNASYKGPPTWYANLTRSTPKYIAYTKNRDVVDVYKQYTQRIHTYFTIATKAVHQRHLWRLLEEVSHVFIVWPDGDTELRVLTPWTTIKSNILNTMCTAVVCSMCNVWKYYIWFMCAVCHGCLLCVHIMTRLYMHFHRINSNKKYK